MKKMISLLLALAMVLSLSISFAEDAEKVTIYYDDGLSFAMLFPEGYKYDETVESGVLLITVESEKISDPNYILVVAPDEEYDELDRLNDLTTEQLDAFAQAMTEDMNDPTYEVAETGLGSKLIVINEQGAEYDYAVLASVYHGYQLFLYIGHNDGAEVTKADVEQGIQIFTDMDFVTAE